MEKVILCVNAHNTNDFGIGLREFQQGVRGEISRLALWREKDSITPRNIQKQNSARVTQTLEQ